MNNLKAVDVADMINNMCFNNKEFCKDMEKEHRTLQQDFTRLCIEWLKTCASENYRYDGRNEASHILGKILTEGHEHMLCLPNV